MNFLGIGTFELLVILLVGLLVIGPVGMVDVARKTGAFIRRFRQSEIWQLMQGSQATLKRVERDLLSDTDLEGLRRDMASLDLSKPNHPNNQAAPAPVAPPAIANPAATIAVTAPAAVKSEAVLPLPVEEPPK